MGLTVFTESEIEHFRMSTYGVGIVLELSRVGDAKTRDCLRQYIIGHDGDTARKVRGQDIRRFIRDRNFSHLAETNLQLARELAAAVGCPLPNTTVPQTNKGPSKRRQRLMNPRRRTPQIPRLKRPRNGSTKTAAQSDKSKLTSSLHRSGE